MVETPQSPLSAPGFARAPTRALRPRVVFVDGLRLLAALQMVQGHSLDALLAAELRHGSTFRAWTFARGLTSPAFLVTTGLSFALATAPGAGLVTGRVRRLKRAAQLVLLGYLMRAPLGVLFGDDVQAALRNAVLVDVLQCIGVCLALLELGCARIESRAGRAWLGAALGTLCFALGPASEQVLPQGAWLPLLNYLSASAGSLFPLLPWAGFVFWGLTLGQAVLAWSEQEEAVSAPPLAASSLRGRLRLGLGARLVSAGALACVASAALFALLPPAPARVSAAHALLKLGLVVMVAGVIAGWLRGKMLPPRLRQLSSETLFLYVSHVVLLYASHVGLGPRIGRTLGLAGALGWALVLLIGCSAGALAYRRAQQALRARGGRGTPRPQPTSSPG
jgi:uncharacterized membrane protein